MSIVTLKKKSQAMHSQVSKNEFNINGVLRQPPHNIFRTPTYTRMKGPDPVGVGAGSHCRVGGREAKVCKRGYPVNIINTGITHQTVANKSTYSNVAMLSRFRKYTHGQFAVSSNFPSKSFEDYIKELERKVMNCNPLIDNGYSVEDNEYSTAPCNVIKNMHKHKLTYGEYMLKLTSKCVKPSLPIKIWHTNTLIGSIPVPSVEQLTYE
jgi:hypothetical protein